MKVIISELIWPEGVERLQKEARVVYDQELWKDSERLQAELTDADALIVRNQTQVTAALLDSGPALRAVGRLGVGLDNVDLEAANSRSTPVIYARNANAVSVAEYVIAAILHLSRGLATADADVKAGNWDRRRFTGAEVRGKTLGLIGVGEISQRVARRAAAFGMRILGHDPYLTTHDYPTTELGVELVGLENLLQESDFVSLHLPITPSTRGLLSGEEFEKMKPGASLINTSRGGIVDETALARALESGEIGGAVLDVLEREPIPESHPLLAQGRARESVVLTPHVAGLTEEAQVNTSVLVAEEVLKVLRGEPSLCVAG